MTTDIIKRLRDDVTWVLHAATVGGQNESHPDHARYIECVARIRADMDLIDSMAQRDLAWRDRFKAAVYDNLAAADNQDVPLEEYPDRILSVLDSFAPAGMAQRQCRGIPGRGCDYLAQCGSVCNKCGRVHDSQLDPTAEQRVPLTDEQVFADDGIMAANARIGIPLSEIMEIVRATEQAHGIRSEK